MALKGVVEESFPDVLVRGEVSNWRPAGSGHVYFSLKDAGATLPAVLWRGSAARLKFKVEDGMEVVVSGKIVVYTTHGKYQFVCDTLTPLGLGDRHVRFALL